MGFIDTIKGITNHLPGIRNPSRDSLLEEYLNEYEDYSDLADEPVDESYDDSDYSDLADDPVEDYMDDSDDYSDMADNIDTGSYDDSSFDGSDAPFDSGDTGSFDGGGDSIE